MRQKYALILTMLIALLAACNRSPTEPPAPMEEPLIIEPTAIAQERAALQSYRAHLVAEFHGTRNGQPARGHLEAHTAKQPHAEQYTLTVETNLPHPLLNAGQTEFVRHEEQLYLKPAERETWLTFPAEPESLRPTDFGLFELESLLILPPLLSGPAITTTLPTNEGSLITRLYPFNETALTNPNIDVAAAQGGIWLATDAEHALVQYVLSATINTIVPHTAAAWLIDHGRLHLTYTLHARNTQFPIEPPTAAYAGNPWLSRFPPPPHAHILSIFPTLVEYTAPLTAEGAANFYHDEITAHGWEMVQAEVYTGRANMMFAHETERINVVITPHTPSDTVKILLDFAPHQ